MSRSAIALDPATSEFYDKDKKKYVFKKSDKSEKTSEQMVEFWSKWVSQYPIVSIEDGMAEDDWDGWKKLTEALGKKIQLVGDDLFVTNSERLQQGIDKGIGEFDPGQGEPDWFRYRNAGGHAAGGERELYSRGFPPLGRDGGRVHR